MNSLKLPAIALFACCIYSSQISVLAQPLTYSPYSKEQLREFNAQPIASAISVGEIDGQRKGSQDFNNAKLYRQPLGEEEAEALETQSADPYMPTKPVMTF